MNEDQKLSHRYRELGSEEPPRHVDEAILAASRRAAEMHPAPLVAPTGRRRWYFPLAAAAVIVLAVAVTVHVERERPDPESAVAMQAPAPRPEMPAENKAAAPPAKREGFKLEERREPARAPEAARADRMLGKQVVEPPEKWLERIAELRKQGKHDEADKALEEFRKRYPDYKIPESVLKK